MLQTKLYVFFFIFGTMFIFDLDQAEFYLSEALHSDYATCEI